MANTVLNIQCTYPGASISALTFASYGNPTGTCPAFSKGTCDASNTSNVVSAACVGSATCTVYPNTTTFGDPCFGTAKELRVVLTCSTGAGSAVCGVVPPPAPPSLPNFTASVEVDVGVVLGPINVEPSIQVVSQHFLNRDSPIHDAAFATLRQLGARRVRFVPWVMYAAPAVGELMPPSFPHTCGPQNWVRGQDSQPATLTCGPGGGTIASIDFASFGTPTGNCGGYATHPTCHAPNSTSVVAALCTGKESCVIPTAPGGVFGTPCAGDLWLAVQASCSGPPTLHTYWNFTAPDALLQDFWEAVDGNSSEPIPNFSTQPTWLYSPTDYNWQGNPNQPSDYTRGPASAVNVTALGEYYGRLYGYFKQGWMVDEGGVTHTRPSGPLNITLIEVFNEVDYEHGYTPELYTASFDAVVQGVRRAADPGKTISFVGLNLPNIDSGAKVAQWATYFLNTSNHAPGARDALQYIGYHAYPTNGGYTPDPTTFARLFDYADTLIEATVKPVDAVIAALSPGTKTVLDETGTDMDGVLSGGGGSSPPNDNPRYWVAAAGYWAYIYARASNESSSVVQVGASQFMDAPGQEPSVTLVDWASGNGTARFWVVRLFVETFDVGVSQRLGTTTVSGGGGGGGAGGSNSSAVYAMGFSGGKGGKGGVLLINKRNAWANVTVACKGGPCQCEGVRVVDEFNGLSPARAVQCDAGTAENTAAVQLAPYATAIMGLTGL